MERVHIVVVNNGDTEPELWAFEDPDDADEFAAVRGGAAAQEVPVIDEHEAKRIIRDEARERRCDDLFNQMREEGRI